MDAHFTATDKPSLAFRQCIGGDGADTTEMTVSSGHIRHIACHARLQIQYLNPKEDSVVEAFFGKTVQATLDDPRVRRIGKSSGVAVGSWSWSALNQGQILLFTREALALMGFGSGNWEHTLNIYG